MSLVHIGDTWREKGRRKRPVVITAGDNYQVRVQFADTKREVLLYVRTLAKYFTRGLALMSMGTCRSCNAPVVWAKKADGRTIPLDPVEPTVGNVRIDGKGFAVVGKRGTGPYQPHFVTCPQAEIWRRGKKPGTNGGNAA